MKDTGQIFIGSSMAILARWQRNAVDDTPYPLGTCTYSLMSQDKNTVWVSNVPMTYIPGTDSDFLAVLASGITGILTENDYVWVKKTFDYLGFHDEQWENYLVCYRPGKC